MYSTYDSRTFVYYIEPTIALDQTTFIKRHLRNSLPQTPNCLCDSTIDLADSVNCRVTTSYTKIPEHFMAQTTSNIRLKCHLDDCTVWRRDAISHCILRYSCFITTFTRAMAVGMAQGVTHRINKRLIRWPRELLCFHIHKVRHLQVPAMSPISIYVRIVLIRDTSCWKMSRNDFAMLPVVPRCICTMCYPLKSVRSPDQLIGSLRWIS